MYDITPIIEAVAALIAALIEAAVYELNTNGIVPVIGIPDAVVTTTIETTTENPKEE